MLALAAWMRLACPSPDPSSLYRIQRGPRSYIGAPRMSPKSTKQASKLSSFPTLAGLCNTIFGILHFAPRWQVASKLPLPSSFLAPCYYAMLLLAILLLAMAIPALTARLVPLSWAKVTYRSHKSAGNGSNQPKLINLHQSSILMRSSRLG